VYVFSPCDDHYNHNDNYHESDNYDHNHGLNDIW
jgi:hypothetical protein